MSIDVEDRGTRAVVFFIVRPVRKKADVYLLIRISTGGAC